MPSRLEFIMIIITVAFISSGIWVVNKVNHTYITDANEVIISDGKVYWVNHKTGIACLQLPQKIEGQVVWGRKSLCGVAVIDALVLHGE